MKTQQQSWMLKLSTFVVVTACFLVLLGSLLVSQNLNKLLSLWGQDIQLTVYLSGQTGPEDKQKIQEWLQGEPQVQSVQFVTQEKALDNFRTQLSSYAPDLSKDEELLQMIPESLEVRLKESVPAGEQLSVMKKLEQGLGQFAGIDEVSYGQDWIQKYSHIVSGFRAGFNGLGILLSLAVLFIISNVVRTSVFNRHDEIVVLEMVGASFSRIRKPFLIEGALLGFFSTAFAMTFCYVLFISGKIFLERNLSFLQLSENLKFFSPLFVASSFILGTGIGMLASYICIRSINDGFSGRQRGVLD